MVGEFPSAEEWRNIYDASPFPPLLELVRGSFGETGNSIKTGIDGFAQSVTLRRLEVELHNRVVDVARSYVFMKFFYSQGIPDERWCISPGRGGHSIEYFQDFEEKDFVIKGWFDFYADTFYQKMFAAWDVGGHVLNAQYSLGIKDSAVDFTTAVRRLKPRDELLAEALGRVLADDTFRQAKALRNDIAHNESPASTGMTVTISKTEEARVYRMGTRAYVTSKAVVENATMAVALLRSTLEAVRKQAA